MVETTSALIGALGELPRRQRATLVLRYFEDLPEAEVAHILGCSLGTMKSTTSRDLLHALQGGPTTVCPFRGRTGGAAVQDQRWVLARRSRTVGCRFVQPETRRGRRARSMHEVAPPRPNGPCWRLGP
jgi:hypothetical protein